MNTQEIREALKEFKARQDSSSEKHLDKSLQTLINLANQYLEVEGSSVVGKEKVYVISKKEEKEWRKKGSVVITSSINNSLEENNGHNKHRNETILRLVKKLEGLEKYLDRKRMPMIKTISILIRNYLLEEE